MQRVTLHRHVVGSMVALALLAHAPVCLGASLTVSWEPHSDHGVAGYILSYGTTPGVYSHRIDVGNVTATILDDLTAGRPYYVVVQSYNTWGIVSPASAVVVGHPADFGPRGASVARSPATPRLSISCPVPVATSPGRTPVSVQFDPSVRGGVPPLATRCSPASGSLFLDTVTSFTCEVTDASRQSASCASAVWILGPGSPR